MPKMLDAVKKTVAANVREWKIKPRHWVLLGVWECIVGGLAAQFIAVAGSVEPQTVSVFMVLGGLPLLPILLPMDVQLVIGRLLGVAFMGLMLVVGVWTGGGHLAVWIAPESDWAYEWRYSNSIDASEMGLSGAKVHIESRPHDCEFLTAPMGSKHCHYDRQVTTVRIRQVGAGQLISYDEGKTWSPEVDATSQRLVFVFWTKVGN